MNRRAFIKKGSLLVPALYLPKLASAALNVRHAAGVASFNRKKVASGGGCGVTIASGNIVNQLFSGGSLPAGWSASGSTLAYGQSLPISPVIPCQLPSAGLHATWSGAAMPYVQYDIGAFDCVNTYYNRFYFYVNSTSMNPNGGNSFEIAGADESTGTENAYKLNVEALTNDSDLQLSCAFGGGGGLSSSYSITAANWYRAEIEFQPNGVWAFKVFDASNAQLGTTSSGTSASRCIRSFSYGVPDHNNTAGADVYITGVGISTAGFLGQ